MHPLLGRIALLVVALGAAGSFGCSSVRSSAIRTGPLHLPSRSGAVGIYTTAPPPQARDLGFVEVHAYGPEDGAIENLLPVFARRVAELGGNAAFIQDVRARFQIVNYMRPESYTYGCWPARWCVGTRMYPTASEVMVVSMTGRAMTASGQVGVP